MKRSLLFYSFLAMVAVALLSVVFAGLLIRSEASTAFTDYLQTLPSGMGRGMGRQMMMGAAEQTFLAAVDRGIWLAAIAAMVLAAVVALLGAFYLSRPLKRLTDAAQILADGSLDHRVEANGPSEVTRLANAFNDMAASLSEAEALRRRLVADVAHELRTPVAALRAQAEGIAEGVLAADADRLSSLADDANQLTRLVNDLQELSAADAGRLSYRMERLPLAALLDAEATRARARASAGVEVVSDCPGTHTIEGDEDRLRQVLRNLVDNAIRHTDSGRITLSCTVDGPMAVVSVADTGEGIPDADMPFIFERFYRADAARARDTGGSGIGLAISKRIIEDHGGSVFARPGDAGGAVVGFTVPLADDPQAG
jgi:signal transduction histidine kinase